jgi:signal peptidase I
LLLTAIRLIALQPYVVPSASMVPTLKVGDRILVNRLSYRASGPTRGDVVVFDGTGIWPSGPSAQGVRRLAQQVGGLLGIGPSDRTILTKRVLAVGGDRISCCDNRGRVVRTEPGHPPVPLQEPYVTDDFPFVPGEKDCASTPRSQRCFGPYRVPDGMVLLVGDNRRISDDALTRCRAATASKDCVRWVPADRIVGKLLVTWWPLPRLRIW